MMIAFSDKFITVIEHEQAGYGCPNCNGFHQEYHHTLGEYTVDIKCLDCGIKVKNINPNQPYGVPHPNIQIDIGYQAYLIMTTKHTQVDKARKQVRMIKKRKAIAEAIDRLLTKI